VVTEKRLIPNLAFVNIQVKQVHRITNKITSLTLAFVTGKYYSAVFLDVSQAFNKVWHDDLLFKMQQHLSKKCHAIFKSYLSETYFFIKQHVIREVHEIRSPWSISFICYTLQIYQQSEI
jgi:hypothetical protein